MTQPWDSQPWTSPAPPDPRSPFNGAVLDFSQLSIDQRGGGSTDQGAGDHSGHSLGRDASRPRGHEAVGPRWEQGQIVRSRGRSGAVMTAPQSWHGSDAIDVAQNELTKKPIKNNDLLRMNSDFHFTAPSRPDSSRRAGSNLRTFQDKNIHSKHTTMQPLGNNDPELQSVFDKLNIGTLDALSAQLDALTAKGNNPVTPAEAPQIAPAEGTKLSTTINTTEHVKTSEIQSNKTVKASVDATAAATNVSTGHVAGPSNQSTHAGTDGTVGTINATGVIATASANTNNTVNQTSTKTVKTKTIKVTTVVKGGTSADVAAAAASQAEIANAVAQGKDLNSTEIAAIAAKATEKAAATAAATKAKDAAAAAALTAATSGVPGTLGLTSGFQAQSQLTTSIPVGYIHVRKETNGDSIITLNDGQGQPVVLRATGPIQIERIVGPDGRIKFLINPVKDTRKPPPMTTTTMNPDAEVEPLEEWFTSTITPTTSPGSSFTSAAKSQVGEFITNMANDIGIEGNNQVNTIINDAVSHLIQPISGPHSANSQTTTTSTSVSTQAEPQANTGVTDVGMPTLAPIQTTENVGIVNQGQGQQTNVLNANNPLGAMFTNFNTGIMNLFEPPRIPRPPRNFGVMLGNRGVINPFVSDTNLIHQGPQQHVPKPSQLPPIGSRPQLDTVAPIWTDSQNNPNLPQPGIMDIKPVTQSPVMPKYDLINATPKIEFVPHPA